MQSWDIDFQTQMEIWELFGTSSRAIWTIFEVTLGGQGTAPARSLIHQNWTYSLLFGSYVSAVGFAVICVIQALFSKDTLEVATNDAEAMVHEQRQHKSDTCKKLQQVFVVADTSGDGLLSVQEFTD